MGWGWVVGGGGYLMTIHIVIRKKPSRPDDIALYLNGGKLNRAKSNCYLGFWLTETMSCTQLCSI